jgi:hypothetical protein
MDKINTSKITWVFFLPFVVLIGLLILSWQKFYVEKDYNIFAIVDCDPLQESCFMVDECDGGSITENCIYSVKIILHNAAATPLCDANIDECEPLFCEINNPRCTTILCSEDVIDKVFGATSCSVLRESL